MVAVKDGGPDPDTNSCVMLLPKQKANNMPNDTIQRSIKRQPEKATQEHILKWYTRDMARAELLLWWRL